MFQIKKNALLIPIAKIYFIFAGYILQMVMSRFLTVSQMGIYQYVNSVISPVNMVLIQSGVQSTSYFVSRDEENENKVKFFALKVFSLFSIILFLILQLFAEIISVFITKDIENAIYFRIASGIFIFYGVYAVLIGFINGKKLFKNQALFDMGYTTFKILLIIVSLILGYNLFGVLLSWVISTFVITVIAIFSVKIGKNGFTLKKEYFQYIFPIVIYQFLFYVLLNIDTWLLGYLSSSENVLNNGGNYLAVSNIAKIPFQIVLSITFIIFPIISKSNLAEKENLNVYIFNTFKYAVLFASPFVATIFINPKIFLLIIYGQNYLNNIIPLKISVAGTFFLALFVISNSIIAALGKPKLPVVFIILTIIVASILNFILTKQYFINGTAISMTFSYFFGFCLSYFYLIKIIKFKFNFILIKFSIILILLDFLLKSIDISNIYINIVYLFFIVIIVFILFFLSKELNRNDFGMLKKILK